ncbi:unnamed protein product [Dibothriocephalus latus]|uniref:Uncharacterized protein n=1 Tax=Dibothriocephalus latus TaxID=60516 RepID=A0A3P6U9H4_DIBLA|nr:unnamed protein product [Dibothriocephalus latus]
MFVYEAPTKDVNDGDQTVKEYHITLRKKSANTSLDLDVGYVIIKNPTLRQRITAVYDTARKRQLSIRSALKHGIAGFEGVSSESEEVRLSQEQQKQRFFVYDTANRQKLSFEDAVRMDILSIDSCSNEKVNFSEYSKDKSLNHALVYRVEGILCPVRRSGSMTKAPERKDISDEWITFSRALKNGLIDKQTGDIFICEHSDPTVCRILPFTKALELGLVKAVPLRHCLIERLPRPLCIFI